MECFGAFHSILGVVDGVISYALEETAKFFGVRLVTGCPEARVTEEVAVLHGLPSCGVEEGER